MSIAYPFGHRFKSDWGSWVRLRMCRRDLSPVWLPGDESAGPAVGPCQRRSLTEWEKLASYQPPRYVNKATSWKKGTWPIAAKRFRADETWFKKVRWGKWKVRKKEPSARTRGCCFTMPLARGLSPSLTTTTDCSPDGLSALNKNRLTTGRSYLKETVLLLPEIQNTPLDILS